MAKFKWTKQKQENKNTPNWCFDETMLIIIGANEFEFWVCASRAMTITLWHYFSQNFGTYWYWNLCCLLALFAIRNSNIILFGSCNFATFTFVNPFPVCVFFSIWLFLMRICPSFTFYSYVLVRIHLLVNCSTVYRVPCAYLINDEIQIHNALDWILYTDSYVCYMCVRRKINCRLSVTAAPFSLIDTLYSHTSQLFQLIEHYHYYYRFRSTTKKNIRDLRWC